MILLALDIDDTVLPWERGHSGIKQRRFRRTVQVLNGILAQIPSTLLLSTARGLSAYQQIEHMLAPLPYAFLGLNCGQQLFLRNNLAQFDEVVSWKQTLVASHSWDTVAITDGLYDGFSAICSYKEPTHLHSSEGEDLGRTFLIRSDKLIAKELRLFTTPGQSFFFCECAASDGAGIKDFLLHLLDEILSTYKFELLITERSSVNEKLIFECLLRPPGITKSSIVKFLLREHMQDTVAVISAGDGRADIPVLETKFFEGVPNHSLWLGAQAHLEDKSSPHSHGRIINPDAFAREILRTIRSVQKQAANAIVSIQPLAG